MPKTTPEKNNALVLEAFDTLFNKRDYAVAERFWSPKYIQHSAHTEPGREGLFNLIRSARGTLRYENQRIAAEGDYVMTRSIHRKPKARLLGRSRRCPLRRRSASRALGLTAGRSRTGRVRRRSSHV